jgi:hypothetical protein
MKNNNKKQMNISVILALIVTYLEKQIEYTELKLEHHKQWQADEEECENDGCEDDDCEGECEVEVTEEAIISFSDEQQPSFDESFKEEWS